MNRKTVYILVAVLIVVIVAAVGGVLLWNNWIGNTKPASVANATSLQFTANITPPQGVTVTHVCYGKNINASNFMIRVDMSAGELGNWSYILNAGQGKSWNRTNNGALTESSNFTADWDYWETRWTNLVTNLKNWSGTGDYSYTSPNGYAVVISSITVNPDLPDSLFQPS